MVSLNYYLLSALPLLPEIGSPPPLTLASLYDQVSESPGPMELVEALILGDDLIQRDALLAGEIEQVEPVVLSAAQVRNEEPLPPYLAIMQQDSQPEQEKQVDVLWESYFSRIASVARRLESVFLGSWVNREVCLRNALAQERAKTLGLEPADYLVGIEKFSCDEDFTSVVNEWASVENPLEGLKILDKNRWAWLSENDSWFSFKDDELAAYAAKLILLNRWQRLTSQSRKVTPAAQAAGANREE